MVRQSELFFLWCMLHSYRVDSGYFLAKQFSRVAHCRRGAVVIGGLITPLALYLGIVPYGTAEASGNSRLDIESCVAIKLIIRRGDSYCLAFKGSQFSLPLPNPGRTTIRVRENWRIQPVDDPQPDPVDTAPPASGAFYFGGSSTSDSMMSILREIREEQLHQHEVMVQFNTNQSCMHDEQMRQREAIDQMESTIASMRMEQSTRWEQNEAGMQRQHKMMSSVWEKLSNMDERLSFLNEENMERVTISSEEDDFTSRGKGKSSRASGSKSRKRR